MDLWWNIITIVYLCVEWATMKEKWRNYKVLSEDWGIGKKGKKEERMEGRKERRKNRRKERRKRAKFLRDQVKYLDSVKHSYFCYNYNF